jgi:phosphopantetheine--protein transferase-like protein
MKILGIGVDIIQNKRIQNLLKNKKFINRTFSKNEIKLSKKHPIRLIILLKDLLLKRHLLKL